MTAARKMCYDRILPRDVMRPLLTTTGRNGMPRAISPRGKAWLNGSNGSETEQAIAREQALWWADYANLTFDFGNAPDADIRISFNTSDGAWSYLGTDARQIPANEATMNLGFLDGGTAGHEFGHAIGLAHEHSSPSGGIEWNEPVVLADLAGPPNYWDEATTRHNVFFKYSIDQIHGTEFDPESIMLYAFPGSWTKNGIATHANEILSALDAEFVAGAKMYPKGGTVPSTATLLTVGADRASADIGKAGEEDLFRFTAYQIDTRGKTDVYMKLFGPNSQTALINEDDDSGYGLNPKISAQLLAGDYYVQIRHYDNSGTGSYTIGVKKR